MSITLIVWCCLFVGMTVLAFQRPAWGVAVYMLTVFLCPPFWWWGDPIAGYRWNFYSGWILLAAVLFSQNRNSTDFEWQSTRVGRRILWLAVAILANATFVHFLLADSLEISAESYTYLFKYVLLFLLIVAAIRTPEDYRIVVMSILLGAAYIGYEVTINERGYFRGGRLEGIGLPNASTANGLASLMVAILPLAGTFFVVGRKTDKLLMFVTAPLIVNVILLCNSRGAFLASIGSGIAFLAATPRTMRKKALKLVALGCVAVWLLLGDPEIIERFWTTFADPEERDASAAGRLEYWKAGLRMVEDYPLGAGGDAFKKVHGPRYIAQMSQVEFESRSVHNGYINEACQWGIQGLLLRLAFVGSAGMLLWKATRSRATTGDSFGALVGAGILAGMVGFLITSFFGDYLSDEWGYWLAALAIAHTRVFDALATFPDWLDRVKES